MTQLLSLALALLIASPLLAVDISKTYDLPAFTGIDTSGGYDIDLVIGQAQKITATSNHKTLKRLNLTVDNGILEINMKSSDTWFDNDSENIKLVIHAKDIKSIDVAGSLDLNAKGIHGKKLSIDSSGSVDMILAGTIGILNIEVSGSGDIDSRLLNAKKVDLEIAGAGVIQVKVSESLDTSISGTGDISYYGSPKTVNSSVTGSGKVSKKG